MVSSTVASDSSRPWKTCVQRSMNYTGQLWQRRVVTLTVPYWAELTVLCDVIKGSDLSPSQVLVPPSENPSPNM